MSGKPRILLAADYFRPGFRAGGPIRTLGNLVDHLGGEFDFSIVTRNHDFGHPAPYGEIVPDCWSEVGPAHVYYASAVGHAMGALARLVQEAPHDLLYLNSFFSSGFTVPLLMLRKKDRLPRRPVLLAPRGEFAPDALALKRWRKSAWLTVAKLMGLMEGVAWQASGPHEREQIRAQFSGAAIGIAPDLGGVVPAEAPPAAEKSPGRLDLLFLGRMAPMKNLETAYALLGDLPGEVRLTLCGPREDPGYWAACESVRAGLPDSVRVEVLAEVPPERIPAIIARHHLLLLPTRGENFGHAILECLSQGCPVLISDRTPWRGLEEAGAGWDIPLEAPERFRAALRRAMAMDQSAWDALRREAIRFAAEHAGTRAGVETARALFHAALAGKVG